MEFLKGLVDFFMTNKENIAVVMLSLIGVAEVIVRLTPTEKDDGAVQRIGEVIKKVLDFLKLPNVKK